MSVANGLVDLGEVTVKPDTLVVHGGEFGGDDGLLPTSILVSWDGAPPIQVRDVALNFIKEYAQEHEFFTGGDVLAAYRIAQKPGWMSNWRNKWGALISEGARKRWYRKAGKIAPNTFQSHTDRLVQWKSLIYTGTQSLTGKTVADQLDEIRKRFCLREITLIQALWMAVQIGEESEKANEDC